MCTRSSSSRRAAGTNALPRSTFGRPMAAVFCSKGLVREPSDLDRSRPARRVRLRTRVALEFDARALAVADQFRQFRSVHRAPPVAGGPTPVPVCRSSSPSRMVTAVALCENPSPDDFPRRPSAAAVPTLVPVAPAALPLSCSGRWNSEISLKRYRGYARRVDVEIVSLTIRLPGDTHTRMKALARRSRREREPARRGAVHDLHRPA